MIYTLYTYYDRVSGLYSAPIPAVNDATALRSFVETMRKQSTAPDMELYRVGSYDIKSGAFVGCDKPEFICGYQDYANKAGD